MPSRPQSSQGWKKRKKRRRSRRSVSSGQLTKNLILLGLVLVLAGSLFVLGFFAYVSRDLPNPDSLTERSISQTTKIYDRTGEHLLYEIFGEENRTLKQLQEGFCEDDGVEFKEDGIPLYAVQATIAAEDRKFCEHGGFDVKGLARAVFQNLRGNRVGGSTLTQQLVKNAILSSEKTFTRKAKELILSVELERRYTKDEILQIYFNEIPYGSTYYGIEAAAQNYFGLSVDELTIGQAATIASLPKAPTTYLNNPDRLVARRDYILSEMKELGFITEDEHNDAVAEETPVEVKFSNIDAPHFVLHVKEQLEETYGRRAVEEGGMKVLTTLDYDKQQIAEEEVALGVEENAERYEFSNAALVAMDPRNGQVLSMVGSKDYFDDEIDGQVNVATRLRQPGSSFKPIVFTKAFEMGYTPNTVVWDVLTDFPTFSGLYTPRNYDLNERGPVRLRDALQGSLNIPAVKMIYMVGVENALDFASSLGYSSFSDHSAFGLSLVLGGGEVQLLEHVNAYGVFANEGVRNDIVTILRVEDAQGSVLEEYKEQEGMRVLDENTARTITHVLSDNGARIPFFGDNSPLVVPGHAVAAKTGTTNDYRDGWLMGYTPSLVVGVWGGNNDNSEMKRGAGGSTVAGPIWNSFMRRALEGVSPESFRSPIISKTGKSVLDGHIDSRTVVVDKASGKLATQFTPDSYKEERTYAQYHSLLHYVNKDDLLGDAPTGLESDENYIAWEQGVSTWLATREEETGIKITQDVPPEEEDDVHVAENFPVVSIESPRRNQRLDGRDLSIDVNASAPRGVSRVEFYIDGLYLETDVNAPFAFSGMLPSLIDKGLHTIKVVAYDDIDNSGSATVSVQVSEDAPDASLEMIDPKHGQTIDRIVDVYTVILSLDDPAEYSSVSIFADELGGGSRELVGQILNPSSPFLSIEWELPASGTFALSARANRSGGENLQTPGVLVTIVPVDAPEEPGSESEEVGEEEVFVPDSTLDLFVLPEMESAE